MQQDGSYARSSSGTRGTPKSSRSIESPVDQAGEDAAERLNAQRQRRHIQQQQVPHITLEHAALQPSVMTV
jgi:NAD-specific glutamate dehydrogenase